MQAVSLKVNPPSPSHKVGAKDCEHAASLAFHGANNRETLSGGLQDVPPSPRRLGSDSVAAFSRVGSRA